MLKRRSGFSPSPILYDPILAESRIKYIQLLHEKSNQKWVPPTTPALFNPNNQVIKSRRRDNFCLDVAGPSKDNGAKVVQWDCHGGDNQLWRLDEKKRLVSKHSGKCLDVAGASKDNGAKVVQSDCHDGDHQKWSYDSQDRLHPLHADNLCLDVDSDQNGANIKVGNCHGNNNQKWVL